METHSTSKEANCQQLNKLFYKNETFFHSGNLNLKNIFTKDNLEKYLTASDLEKLSKFLPNDKSVQVIFPFKFYLLMIIGKSEEFHYITFGF